jgi:hypothetical protein
MPSHGSIIVIGQSKSIKFHINPFGTLPRCIFICPILIFTLFEAEIHPNYYLHAIILLSMELL